MNTEQLLAVSGTIGVALSIALKYVPYLREGYDRLSTGWKSGVVVALLLVSVVVLILFSDAELADGILSFLIMLTGSQATHTVTRKL